MWLLQKENQLGNPQHGQVVLPSMLPDTLQQSHEAAGGATLKGTPIGQTSSHDHPRAAEAHASRVVKRKTYLVAMAPNTEVDVLDQAGSCSNIADLTFGGNTSIAKALQNTHGKAIQ